MYDYLLKLPRVRFLLADDAGAGKTIMADLLIRELKLRGLGQARWDVVIVDEAHRMSWTPPTRKTVRYAPGELLRDATDHYLLLTATPHKGNPEHAAPLSRSASHYTTFVSPRTSS